MRAVNDSTAAPRATRSTAGRWRGALALTVTGVALTACGGGDPAATNHLGFEDGVAPAAENSLTTMQAVLLYGLVPLAILLLTAALVWLPGMIRSSRYRPARGWNAPPLWFGGPADPAAAVESAQTGDVARGGASGNW